MNNIPKLIPMPYCYKTGTIKYSGMSKEEAEKIFGNFKNTNIEIPQDGSYAWVRYLGKNLIKEIRIS